MALHKLLERVARPFLQDHTIILLDRMDMHPENFATLDERMWNREGMRWLDITLNGTYPVLDLLVIRTKCRAIKLSRTRNAILELLVNGVDEGK